MKATEAAMNQVIHARVARRVNELFKLKAHVVTAEQVACVADGSDFTASHPIHQAIKTELKGRAK